MLFRSSALALQGGSAVVPLRRQVRRGRPQDDEPLQQDWPPEREQPSSRTSGSQSSSRANSWAGPSRNADEPAPTVSVPFRVIRRNATATASSTDTASATASATASSAATAATATGDDDWSNPVNDDW